MITESFKHIIITRFNLVVNSQNSVIDKVWKLDRNNNVIQTDKWLKLRFRLFERFCLPSILNQSNKNFVWLIYFDKETPLEFKKKIEGWAANYNFFKPIYEDSYDGFMRNLSAEVKSKSQSFPYVITTRLDNDDSLQKDTIDLIQKRFVSKHNVPINLPLGHCVQLVKNKVQVSTLFDSVDGPFVSLIEETSLARTVYSKKHTAYLTNPSLVQIRDKPLWLQVIHETNMLNFIRGKVKRVNNMEYEYGISIVDVSYNPIKEVKQNIWYVMRLIVPANFRKIVYDFINRLRYQ